MLEMNGGLKHPQPYDFHQMKTFLILSKIQKKTLVPTFFKTLQFFEILVFKNANNFNSVRLLRSQL